MVANDDARPDPRHVTAYAPLVLRDENTDQKKEAFVEPMV